MKICSDLEWKLIYVGSAEDETYDQLLESVLVGPVNVGNYRFVLQVIFTELPSRPFKLIKCRAVAISSTVVSFYEQKEWGENLVKDFNLPSKLFKLHQCM